MASFVRPEGCSDDDLTKIVEIAAYGILRHPFSDVKPLLVQFLRSSIFEFEPKRDPTALEDDMGPSRPYEMTATGIADRLISLLEGFTSYPFTIQRVCELVLQPRKQYTRMDKFAQALERALQVTTTLPQDLRAPQPAPTLTDLPTEVNIVRCAHPPEPLASVALSGPLLDPSSRGLEALHNDQDLNLLTRLMPPTNPLFGVLGDLPMDAVHGLGAESGPLVLGLGLHHEALRLGNAAMEDVLHLDTPAPPPHESDSFF